MAASKKNAKGSKTAHVLNLLTAPDAPREGDPAGEETAAEASAEQAAPAAGSRPLLPPILEVAQSNDDNLARQIQHALEEELEETSEAQPTPPLSAEPPAQPVVEVASPVVTEQAPAPAAPEATPEPAPALEPEPAPQPAPEPEPVPEPEPAPQPIPEPQPEPKPAPPAAKPAPQPPEEEEEDVTYTNVMQVLVEEKAPKYIKKFGLCDCKHCAADVKALTLSNLVPKYVVLSRQDRIPMLTVYEGRFSSTIFAQLTRACKIVMDHPHHSREE